MDLKCLFEANKKQCEALGVTLEMFRNNPLILFKLEDALQKAYAHKFQDEGDGDDE